MNMFILESEAESQPIVKISETAIDINFVAYLTEVLLLQGTGKGAWKVIK